VCFGSLNADFICVQILAEVFGEHFKIWVVYVLLLLSCYLTLHLNVIVPLLTILRAVGFFFHLCIRKRSRKGGFPPLT